MRLYGRQSRVRARRRRVLLSLGVVVALLAIPLGHLLLQRGSVAQGVRVAGVPLGGASRAEAEREITAAVGDQLRREVTVTVAGRSATLSPWALGVRVDAKRTASTALAAGRVLAAEDHGVDGADARAGEHGDDRLGHHRHINDDAVAHRDALAA